jgi:hypothetical protein
VFAAPLVRKCLDPSFSGECLDMWKSHVDNSLTVEFQVLVGREGGGGAADGEEAFIVLPFLTDRLVGPDGCVWTLYGLCKDEEELR